MVSTFVGQQILKCYIKNRIPTLFIRGTKTETAVNLNDDQLEQDKLDMPTVEENPYAQEKKKCILCKYQIEPDYKNVRLLSQFQSRFTGQIYERNITGLCKNKQHRVEQEIRKAQVAGLMGVMTKDPKYVDDPQLFSPSHPFRPHKY